MAIAIDPKNLIRYSHSQADESLELWFSDHAIPDDEIETKLTGEALEAMQNLIEHTSPRILIINWHPSMDDDLTMLPKELPSVKVVRIQNCLQIFTKPTNDETDETAGKWAAWFKYFSDRLAGLEQLVLPVYGHTPDDIRSLIVRLPTVNVKVRHDIPYTTPRQFAEAQDKIEEPFFQNTDLSIDPKNLIQYSRAEGSLELSFSDNAIPDDVPEAPLKKEALKVMQVLLARVNPTILVINWHPRMNDDLTILRKLPPGVKVIQIQNCLKIFTYSKYNHMHYLDAAWFKDFCYRWARLEELVLPVYGHTQDDLRQLKNDIPGLRIEIRDDIPYTTQRQFAEAQDKIGEPFIQNTDLSIDPENLIQCSRAEGSLELSFSDNAIPDGVPKAPLKKEALRIMQALIAHAKPRTLVINWHPRMNDDLTILSELPLGLKVVHIRECPAIFAKPIHNPNTHSMAEWCSDFLCHLARLKTLTLTNCGYTPQDLIYFQECIPEINIFPYYEVRTTMQRQRADAQSINDERLVQITGPTIDPDSQTYHERDAGYLKLSLGRTQLSDKALKSTEALIEYANPASLVINWHRDLDNDLTIIPKLPPAVKYLHIHNCPKIFMKPTRDSTTGPLAEWFEKFSRHLAGLTTIKLTACGYTQQDLNALKGSNPGLYIFIVR